MSGGVDSSVAAKLLVDQGHEVMGIFLHFWKDSGGTLGKIVENKCCSTEALMDARRVCEKLGIKLYTLNFSSEFKKEVVDNFLNEYKIGNTPNPCIVCNKFVKLGLLIKKARELGFDYVASGHYARLGREIPNPKSQIPNKLQITNSKFQTRYRLYRAKDEEKDQSYFLYTLAQEQLKHLIFPLGDYTKDEVRKIAKKAKLPVAEKKESQEICFIPEKSHNEFLKRYLKLKPGTIKTMDGEKIGKHQGLPLYTIGQRRGVEIGGTGPYYVAKCDYKTNTLYVVENGEDESLYSNELIAENINWVSGDEPRLLLKCEAVIRYRHKPIECQVKKLKVKSRGNKYLVKFKKPQRAVTPGQSVVFYSSAEALPCRQAGSAKEDKNDEVLGGGIILK